MFERGAEFLKKAADLVTKSADLFEKYAFPIETFRPPVLSFAERLEKINRTNVPLLFCCKVSFLPSGNLRMVDSEPDHAIDAAHEVYKSGINPFNQLAFTPIPSDLRTHFTVDESRIIQKALKLVSDFGKADGVLIEQCLNITTPFSVDEVMLLHQMLYRVYQHLFNPKELEKHKPLIDGKYPFQLLLDEKDLLNRLMTEIHLGRVDTFQQLSTTELSVIDVAFEYAFKHMHFDNDTLSKLHNIQQKNNLLKNAEVIQSILAMQKNGKALRFNKMGIAQIATIDSALKYAAENIKAHLSEPSARLNKRLYKEINNLLKKMSLLKEGLNVQKLKDGFLNGKLGKFADFDIEQLKSIEQALNYYSNKGYFSAQDKKFKKDLSAKVGFLIRLYWENFILKHQQEFITRLEKIDRLQRHLLKIETARDLSAENKSFFLFSAKLDICEELSNHIRQCKYLIHKIKGSRKENLIEVNEELKDDIDYYNKLTVEIDELSVQAGLPKIILSKQYVDSDEEKEVLNLQKEKLESEPTFTMGEMRPVPAVGRLSFFSRGQRDLPISFEQGLRALYSSKAGIP